MKYICTILAQLVFSVAFAQHLSPITKLNGVEVNKSDVIQIEAGTGYQFNNLLPATDGDFNKSQNYFLVNYGLNDKTDLQINYNFPNELNFKSDQLRRGNGISTLVFGFKHQLSDQFAFKPDIGFSEDSLGNLKPNLQITGIHEFKLDSWLNWENRIGLSWFINKANSIETDNARITQLLYISRLEAYLSNGFQLSVEAYGNGNTNWQHYGNFGIGKHLNETLYIQLNNGFGNLQSGNAYSLSVQIAYRLIPVRYYDNEGNLKSSH